MNEDQLTLPKETQMELSKTAVLLAMSKPAVRIDRIALVLMENARLLIQLNQLRVQLGLDPLPGYTPRIGK